MDDKVLQRTAELAAAYLTDVETRPVSQAVDLAALRAAVGGPLPEQGESPVEVIEALVAGVDRALIGSAGPRYFGFVVGGSQPAALAADWLTSTWDQNAGLYALSPAASVVEETAANWLVDLFGLPDGTSIGFTTGATMANFTALAAARTAELTAVGWDVEELGLFGAPEINVVLGDEAHVTVFVSLQMLGLGRGRVHRVAADEQGRMRPEALRVTLAGLTGPTIVVAQAGNVNTGAFDPLPEIVEAVREHGGWLHIDGAFGLWAATTPGLRHLTAGVELADSWTTDAHKWLNVPYDSGLVFVRDAGAHHKAMTLGAAYYVETAGGERDPYNWVAESSRRARGFPVYAALRSMGRSGLADMIDRCCAHARRFESLLAGRPGVSVLNDVVLNQVLVRFAPPDRVLSASASAADRTAATDAFTRDVIGRVQADGTCWLGGTTWHGVAAMRISVSSWATTTEDVERSAAAILRCAAAAAEASQTALPA